MSNELKVNLNKHYGLKVKGVVSVAESTQLLGGPIRKIDMKGTQGSKPNLGFTITGSGENH